MCISYHMCIHVYTYKVQPYVYDKDSIKFWYKQPLNKMIYLPSKNDVLAKSVNYCKSTTVIISMQNKSCE